MILLFDLTPIVIPLILNIAVWFCCWQDWPFWPSFVSSMFSYSHHSILVPNCVISNCIKPVHLPCWIAGNSGPRFPLILVCVLGNWAPFPSFHLVETLITSGHAIAICCLSPVNPTVHSWILVNTAWFLAHFVFLPLFLELMHGHDICHTVSWQVP